MSLSSDEAMGKPTDSGSQPPEKSPDAPTSNLNHAEPGPGGLANPVPKPTFLPPGPAPADPKEGEGNFFLGMLRRSWKKWVGDPDMLRKLMIMGAAAASISLALLFRNHMGLTNNRTGLLLLTGTLGHLGAAVMYFCGSHWPYFQVIAHLSEFLLRAIGEH